MLNDLEKYSSLSLRVGLTIVLYWFAFQQLTNPTFWTGLVPSYLSFIQPINVVYLNGIFEFVLGTLIILGLFTRIAAAILALHLIPIIFALGGDSILGVINSPIAVRDIGILFASLALALMGSDYLSIDNSIRRKFINR